jgi:FkbM family methyltransferase
MTILEKIRSGTNFACNFRNPIGIFLKRMIPSSQMLRLIDRATGVRCDCNIASHRMFGETWHDRDYDVPYVAIRPGDKVIDIGANQGFYACYARHQGADVYAFEPTPTSFALLNSNLALNGFSDRVFTKQAAVGGKDGITQLMVSNRLGGGMNTTQKTFSESTQLPISQRLDVQCVSLNSVLDEFSLDVIRCCKMDCEGSELDILAGLDESNRCKFTSFVIEYHPTAYRLNDLIDLLLSWKTHQISFAEDKSYTSRQILRAISNDFFRTFIDRS